jgi:hypothetical protein
MSGAPLEEEAGLLASPHEESSPAPSTTWLLPQSGPPKLQEEVTPESTTKVQKPVNFVSTVLRDMWERYTTQKKLLYTLLIV